MSGPSRADLLPDSRGKVPTDWELRQSIASVGVIDPIVWWDGQIIDGKRRLRVARILRKPTRKLVFTDRIEAARWLWARHPKRAFQLFAPKRARQSALVALFGCSPSELPSYQRSYQSQLARTRHKVAGTDLAHLPRVTVKRETLERAHAVCRRDPEIKSLSATIRRLVEHLASHYEDEVI